jgi:carbamoyl-phosphate synthase small subunit
MKTRKRVFLILDDGSMYPGYGFGAEPLAVDELIPGSSDLRSAGEVVFNTAMSGYHEVLTDPSYSGQLIVMTYPHIGNYGADPAWSEIGPDGEGGRSVKAAGFILRSLYEGPVPAGRISLHELLVNGDIPGISGIDTRRLTLHLRDTGSKTGCIVRKPDFDGTELATEDCAKVQEYLAAFPPMVGRNLVTGVGSQHVIELNPDGAPHIALLDCGSKANIIRELSARGCRITVVPSTTEPSAILALGADAVLASNGPGDPAVLESQTAGLQSLIGKTPLFGICLGHQLISQAIGAKTEKMKFGHHGVNHPVRDERTGRVFVTSQNHGFTVDESSLPHGTSVWFRNANDLTIEGIADDERSIYTAQFHPESAPGPHDSSWIFDAFLDSIRNAKSSSRK